MYASRVSADRTYPCNRRAERTMLRKARSGGIIRKKDCRMITYLSAAREAGEGVRRVWGKEAPYVQQDGAGGHATRGE